MFGSRRLFATDLERELPRHFAAAAARIHGRCRRGQRYVAARAQL